MSLIVAGADHSEGVKAALRFALEEAKLRQATLRAVHAWQFGYVGAPGLDGAYPVLGAEVGDLQHAAEAALESTLAAVTDSQTDVAIERRVVAGAPAGVLVDESRDADMLVVGSRGHGGFAALLLGSVGQQVAHYSACPVAIVHPKRTA